MEVSYNTLDQMEEETNPVHLLGIADTKVGKSTYAAQAAIDGMRVIYIDSDNGASAIYHATRNKPEARKRIHLFRTSHPGNFLIDLLRSRSNKKFYWNLTADRPHSTMSRADDADRILVMDITSIDPAVLFVFDSWTSFSGDAMGLGAAANQVDILDMGNSMQGVYGDANQRVTLAANLLQKLPCHVFVQAHGTVYERYEKPVNKEQRLIKQGEMILRETIAIPVSSSRPHGLTMGSRFNHIGWFSVNRMGETLVDFTRDPGRVGGGPPNKIAKVSELPFVRLVDPSGTNPPVDPGIEAVAKFLMVTTAGELSAARAASTPATQRVKENGTAAVETSVGGASGKPIPSGNPLRPAGSLGGIDLKIKSK